MQGSYIWAISVGGCVHFVLLAPSLYQPYAKTDLTNQLLEIKSTNLHLLNFLVFAETVCCDIPAELHGEYVYERGEVVTTGQHAGLRTYSIAEISACNITAILRRGHPADSSRDRTYIMIH